MNEFRCDICGRFIGMDELENEEAYSTFHPESIEPYQLAGEYVSYTHSSCVIEESVSSSC